MLNSAIVSGIATQPAVEVGRLAYHSDRLARMGETGQFGLDPMEVLILPRVIALLFAMPMLTFISAMAALFGAGIVAFFYGGISPEIFLFRLQNAVGIHTFLVGMIKAPFMALVIGLIATMEGMGVEGSAESLGRQTTSSVVKSIFMVIVVDGIFAMFFAGINY